MSTSMEKVVKILYELNVTHCEILFGEATRFSEWLKEKGVKDEVNSKEYLICIHLTISIFQK